MKKLTKYEKILALVFLLTLPLVNPWVRGDGVGYYAFARAPITQHNLDFRPDWQNANSSFRMGRVDPAGNILPDQFTGTGHLNNHFSIGPAMLWAPVLLFAHYAVLAADALGTHISADGFSRPYLVAMSIATAAYGIAALWISFRIACMYVSERSAFIATLGIWLASSLPVYMYFNPSWSHAQSAFAVALFIWYWLRTLPQRSLLQWIALGALGGLMMDVYYINAVLLLLPLGESLSAYDSALRTGGMPQLKDMFFKDVAFSACLLATFFPTLLIKKIIYGGFLNFGYGDLWDWHSPAFLKVAFSSDHGLFSWTPILVLAVAGLFFLLRRDMRVALGFSGVFLAYLYAIGCYEDWDGISSFGNRFFVSLTPIFIVGLAALVERLAMLWEARPAAWVAGGAISAFILVNLGLIFQWGTHLIPARGPVSMKTAAYNEVVVVPGMALGTLEHYLTGRGALMRKIEDEDVRQLRSGDSGTTP